MMGVGWVGGDRDWGTEEVRGRGGVGGPGWGLGWVLGRIRGVRRKQNRLL